MLNLTYTYDGVGNIASLNDAGATANFAYDALDRLLGVSGAYAETYAYADAQGGKLGNLTSKTGVGSYTYGAQAANCPEGALSRPHAVVTAGSNTYCYDQNGNMRRRTVGGTTYTLSYDAENRLTAISGGATAQFWYNGDGMRVKGTIGGVTTVYAGGHYEKNLTSGVVTKYYAWGGQRIALRQGTELYYLFGDHLGSSSATWRVSNDAIATQRYYPWGTVRSGGSLPTDYTFTGQKAEAGIGGLMFYNARWYDPALGRFAQADSIVPGAFNPQAFNRYSYVLNSPLKYTDPTGYTSVCANKAIADPECDPNYRDSWSPGHAPVLQPWEILLAQETVYAATRNGQFTMPQMVSIAHVLINRIIESGSISDIVGTTELPCLWYGRSGDHCNVDQMPRTQAGIRAKAEEWANRLNGATGNKKAGWLASIDAFNRAMAEARAGIDPTHGSTAYTMLTRTDAPEHPNPEALAEAFWWGTSQLPGYYPRVLQYTSHANSHPEFRWSVTAPNDISILDYGLQVVAIFTANDDCNYYLACGLP